MTQPFGTVGFVRSPWWKERAKISDSIGNSVKMALKVELSKGLRQALETAPFWCSCRTLHPSVKTPTPTHISVVN